MDGYSSDDTAADDAAGEAIWAVVYGDFMSYLMVFFLVLFGFSLENKASGGANTVEDSLSGIQKEFGGSISRDRLERLTNKQKEDEVTEKLKDIISAEGLGDVAKVETSAQWVKLVLTAPVLYDSGSADLKPEAAKMLFNMVAALGKVPGEIVVEGHTDNVPTGGGRYETNWDLSGARANAVVRLLVQWGISPKRLTATGYGEHRPMVPNDTPEHRSQNRRIEIGLRRS